MPDHLHALIAITADTSLSDTVVNFKRAMGEIFWRQMAAQIFVIIVCEAMKALPKKLHTFGKVRSERDW